MSKIFYWELIMIIRKIHSMIKHRGIFFLKAQTIEVLANFDVCNTTSCKNFFHVFTLSFGHLVLSFTLSLNSEIGNVSLFKLQIAQRKIPWFVEDWKECSSCNGMRSSCKYAKMHTMTRYNWRWHICLLSHVPPYPNTQLLIFPSETVINSEPDKYGK